MLTKMSQLINKSNCNRRDIVETGIGNWKEIQKTQEDKRMGTEEDTGRRLNTHVITAQGAKRCERAMQHLTR